MTEPVRRCCKCKRRIYNFKECLFHPNAGTFITFLLLGLLISSGCLTPLDDPNDTYESVFLFDCLNDPVAPEPREGARVTYITPVVDFDTQLTSPTPIIGATLTICTSAACETPFADWERLPSPNAAVWMLSLPFGLRNAVLRFTAPGYVPMDYVLGGPMIGHPNGSLEVRGVGVPLVSEATYASLHQQVGTVADPTRGTFAARVLDCDGIRAANVNVEPLDQNAISGATGFALSTNNFASSSRTITDSRGVSGFFNLPAQNFDAEAFTPYGARINGATFPVRAGVVTLAELRPGLETWGQ